MVGTEKWQQYTGLTKYVLSLHPLWLVILLQMWNSSDIMTTNIIIFKTLLILIQQYLVIDNLRI